MKKLFFIPIFSLLLSATACQTPDNGENDAPEELVEKSMEQLIEDLQNGLFVARDCEIYKGNVCKKPFGETFLGADGAKFYDYGLGSKIAFFNDGTCRASYNNINNHCPSHTSYLYDTWQWSYDITAKTITITAPDLANVGITNTTTTITVLSYKGNNVEIEGALPNRLMDSYTFRYKCILRPHKDRHSFEANCKDEDDYPCCRPY